MKLKYKILIVFPFALAIAFNLPGAVRSLIYYEDIKKNSAAYDVDPMMVVAIIYAESGFIPHAESPKGAVGLMQILPSTYAELKKELNLPADTAALRKPALNIKVGVRYLSKLKSEKWIESEIELLAAYNAGRGKALSWKKTSASGRLTVDKIPYKETRLYVAKVLRAYKWLKKIKKK